MSFSGSPNPFEARSSASNNGFNICLILRRIYFTHEHIIGISKWEIWFLFIMSEEIVFIPQGSYLGKLRLEMYQ
jgi:hypothetical protein